MRRELAETSDPRTLAILVSRRTKAFPGPGQNLVFALREYVPYNTTRFEPNSLLIHPGRKASRGGFMLSPATNAALKEWAIVCRALAEGRQTLLIRKGGIEEIKAGFQVTHRDFWLFPTYVHQKASDLVPAVQAEFAEVQATQPPTGSLQIQLYATVEDVAKVMDLDRLRALEGRHVLSWDCVESRFHYRRPGVHVMALRVYRRPGVVTLENTPEYDGCVSWVDLDCSLETEGCVPVLSDADFSRRLVDIQSRLAGAGIAS